MHDITVVDAECQIQMQDAECKMPNAGASLMACGGWQTLRMADGEQVFHAGPDLQQKKSTLLDRYVLASHRRP